MDEQKREATENELLDQIKTMCGDVQRVPSRARHVLELAEALAWVAYPNQPHGGSGTVSVSK